MRRFLNWLRVLFLPRGTVKVVIERKTVTMLHTDAVPLNSLGTVTVGRAYRVEWNNEDQQWRVLQPDSDVVLYASKQRQACLDYERKLVEQNL